MHYKDRQNNFFDTCRNCVAYCCLGTRPPITSKRKRIIMEYLREHKISIEKPFVQLRYVFPRETDDGYCVFRDKKTRKCLVHAVKPETCVAGPITFDINKETKKIEWHMKMEKICPLAGVVYKDKKLLEKHLVSAKREIQGFVRDLDVEALKAILEIAEPETFKVAENNVARNILDNLVP